MGSVYKVEDELSGDVLALKVLTSSEGADDFRKELLIGRRLGHTNVVRIYDIGVEGATLFITMELVDGQDLAVRLKENGPCRGAAFLSIFDQLWIALDHIHSRQIIHRDIKLRNLMLTRDGTLKMMDFGIAREFGDSRTLVIHSGTPGYLAPELLLGDTPGPLSDVYSAGVVCWELLTGKRPPRERLSLDEQALGIPAHVARLIERCVDHDPAKRPPSAAAVLREAAALATGTKRPLSRANSAAPCRTAADARRSQRRPACGRGARRLSRHVRRARGAETIGRRASLTECERRRWPERSRRSAISLRKGVSDAPATRWP